MESASASAAAALVQIRYRLRSCYAMPGADVAYAATAQANISYWSTEPAPRLSHFKILCAL
eukprot:2579592-Rhodomonas_salina.1